MVKGWESGTPGVSQPLLGFRHSSAVRGRQQFWTGPDEVEAVEEDYEEDALESRRGVYPNQSQLKTAFLSGNWETSLLSPCSETLN